LELLIRSITTIFLHYAICKLMLKGLEIQEPLIGSRSLWQNRLFHKIVPYQLHLEQELVPAIVYPRGRFKLLLDLSILLAFLGGTLLRSPLRCQLSCFLVRVALVTL
jgi:hypothetical protein